MREWLDEAASALGVEPDVVQRHADALLAMVGVVAHGPSRPAAPLTAFLLGQLAAGAQDPDAELERGLRAVDALVAARQQAD